MNENPNPLEPWRPSAGEPLRAEPLRFPPRGEIVEAGGPRPNPPPPGLRGDQLLVGILFLNLIALGAVAFKLLPRNHVPQIISVVVLLGLGLALGISAARNRSGLFRVVLVLAGLGAAAAAWWFVPTTGGLSLFAAQREAERVTAELESLPAGDSARFLELEEASQQLVEQFPEYKDPLEKLSNQWRERSEAKWEDDLNQLGPEDFSRLADLRQDYRMFYGSRLDDAEIIWFDKCFKKLPPGQFRGVVQLRAVARLDENWKKRVQDWETDWADRTVDDVLTRVEPLIARDPREASLRLTKTAEQLRDLDEFQEAQNRLLTARARAFRTALEIARRETFALAAKEQYQAAEAEALRLRSLWGSEAKAVGKEEESDLARFCDGYAFLAEIAQRAKKKDPK